jgi:hypothetical protein
MVAERDGLVIWQEAQWGQSKTVWLSGSLLPKPSLSATIGPRAILPNRLNLPLLDLLPDNQTLLLCHHCASRQITEPSCSATIWPPAHFWGASLTFKFSSVGYKIHYELGDPLGDPLPSTGRKLCCVELASTHLSVFFCR